MSQTYKFGNGTWATKKGSTLAYSDTNNAFKPLPFSFERNSIATRVNKEGLIEVVGNDIPRIDYKDSAEGALLLENSATNLLNYSEDFSQSSWDIPFGNIISNSTISPNGSIDADEFNFIGQTEARIAQSPILSNGTSYTFSMYIKADENGTVQSNMYADGNNYTTINVTTEWKRINITFVAGSTNIIFAIDNRSFSETLNKVYIWGAMLEQNSVASSYIPTNGSTVQRSAETCNDSGNSEVFNDSEGVLFADISALANDLTNRGITISDGSVNNRVTMFYTNVSNAIQVKVVVGGSNSLNSYIVIPNISLHNKFALKYKQNDFSLFVNGFELITDTSGNTFSNGTLTKLAFDRGDAAEDFYGKTKEIGYYDTALTDEELEYMTSYRSLNEMVTELNLNAL